MPDDMKAVVERLEERVAVWSANGPSTTARINIKLTDLRALLSERRKMVEALERIVKTKGDQWSPVEAWELQDIARAALTGSREHG